MQEDYGKGKVCRWETEDDYMYARCKQQVVAVDAWHSAPSKRSDPYRSLTVTLSGWRRVSQAQTKPEAGRPRLEIL